jgi:hypothetical protein
MKLDNNIYYTTLELMPGVPLEYICTEREVSTRYL